MPRSAEVAPSHWSARPVSPWGTSTRQLTPPTLLFLFSFAAASYRRFPPMSEHHQPPLLPPASPVRLPDTLSRSISGRRRPDDRYIKRERKGPVDEFSGDFRSSPPRVFRRRE
ncbi:hypothetical protein NL676_022518 [Syzygium grande]|nr:hypothetical protein NL676_022518 [Syzygium grande]